MIELYVAVTLLGIGYLMKQNKQVVDKMKPPPAPKLRETPSSNTQYDSNRFQQVRAQEYEKAKQAYDLSNQPNSTVINKTHKIKSMLTGQMIDPKEFAHNNMVPWVGKGTAPMKENGSLMEKFGVVFNPTTMAPKREHKPLFEPIKDLGNINGNEVTADFYKKRLEKPRVQNNTLPFQQIRVGPGLNQGYGCNPTGGFQQTDIVEYAMPKDTNEIRAANKPKLTYEGRVVDGQKGSNRGKIGLVRKNRVETFYENNPDKYFKTTGAYLADKVRPEVDAKYTNRTDTTNITYEGPLYQKLAFETRSKVQDPMRSQLAGFDLANPSLVTVGGAEGDDYGKANIAVYGNKRDVTTTQTRIGNLTSLIKAIVAPLEDVLKTSKKEYMVDAEREFGNMGPQFPEKATVRDPNDVARTTIKQTTLQDSEMMNLKGSTRVYVYDPNNIARTTIKQTTLQESDMLNMRGSALKSVVYDPNDMARTTIKETNLHDADRLNVRGAKFASSVYDPNDIARTTIKETTIHDTDMTNIKGPGAPRGQVYDDQEKARATIRQTLSPTNTTINIATMKKAHTVYDPSDPARKTIKETTLDKEHRQGNMDAVNRFNAGYVDEIYDAKTTQKELFSDNDYYGGAKTDRGEGYVVTNMEAKTTQKEFVSDNDYYGTAADQNTHMQMSYEDAYNATINEIREGTLVMREPTQTSTKVVSGSDNMFVQNKKIECDNVHERKTLNADRVVNEMAHIDRRTFTKNKQEYESDDRLDPDLLAAFHENPYTKPLNSFA